MKPAVQGFLQIWQQDPATPYFDAIPLAWMTEPVPPDLESQARTWLADEQSAAARLIGASWLLASPERAAATARLRQLAASPSAEIAFLAEAHSGALLWPLRMPRMPSAGSSGSIGCRNICVRAPSCCSVNCWLATGATKKLR